MESDAVDEFSSSLVLVMFTRQRTCQNSHVLPYCCVQHNMANNKCGITQEFSILVITIHVHHFPLSLTFLLFSCSSLPPANDVIVCRAHCSLQGTPAEKKEREMNMNFELSARERLVNYLFFNFNDYSSAFWTFSARLVLCLKPISRTLLWCDGEKKVGELEKEPPKGDYVEVLITSSSTRFVHFFCALFSFWLANLLTFTRV